MVHYSEGSLGILLSIHEMAKGRPRRVADRPYMYTRRRNGGGSPIATACTNIRIVRVVSAKFKALLIQVQAYRLKFTYRANGLVRFTLGRSLVTGLFDIATP